MLAETSRKTKLFRFLTFFELITYEGLEDMAFATKTITVGNGFVA